MFLQTPLDEVQISPAKSVENSVEEIQFDEMQNIDSPVNASEEAEVEMNFSYFQAPVEAAAAGVNTEEVVEEKFSAQTDFSDGFEEQEVL